MAIPDNSERRPLVITDCDEVLLRMISHFRAWLDEAHDIEFHLSHGFAGALHHRQSGERVVSEEIWKLLNGFFDTEMGRQDEVPGAVAAIAALSQRAEVVVLTNLTDHRQEDRMAQLRALGIDVPVYTNQGPKGPALAKIIEERGGDRPVFFIDDMPQHHESVAQVAPHVIRLHFVGEPAVAKHTACAHEAGHADARIDSWEAALPWLMERIERAGA